MRVIYQPNPDLHSWFYATIIDDRNSYVKLRPDNKNRPEVIRSCLDATVVRIYPLAERAMPIVGDLVTVVDAKGLGDSDVRLGDILKVCEVVEGGVYLSGEMHYYSFDRVQTIAKVTA
jgi:hypothetical protein